MKVLLLYSLAGLMLMNPLHAAKPKVKTEFCQCNPCKCNPCSCGTKCNCCKSDKPCQDCSCKCTQGNECSCNAGDKACCAKSSL